MIIRYDKLRYRLLPYSYSLAWREACDDHSLPPGLPVDCPDDRRARDVGDQFMFGPAFLVAPITEPGADSRSVYLPEAAAWYDFWTGKQLSWTDAIEVSAPLERIPLFVRAGSIVPFGPVAQDADDPLDPLEVRVYPGANGEFEWYPDAADAYDCEKGLHRIVRLHWDDAARTLVLGAGQGNHSGVPERVRIRLVVVTEAHGVGEEPTAVVDGEAVYEGRELRIAAR